MATSILARAVARSWSLPPRRNKVTVSRDVPVPMSDGTVLRADHYIPVISRPAHTVLVRCPYGRGFPHNLINAQLVAERGYHVLMQSCRGTFGSGGDFEPMRNEASDGQDTVAWLRQQDWFSGRFATFGGSYLGFVQWALALDPPPELAAAVVQVGPHDFSRAAYHDGVLDLHNFLGWSYTTSRQEDGGTARVLLQMATADRHLLPAMDRVPLRDSASELLAGRAPWFEEWLGHPRISDPFWEPYQCGAALERLAVPTLLVGGWQDLFLAQTLEQYVALAGRGITTRLIVGPWTHLGVASKGGAAMTESIAWLDRYLGSSGRAGNGSDPGSVRVWVGGAGWREVSGWPPAGTSHLRWHLGAGGTLGPQPPADAAVQPATFRYDPADPTPSPGGAIMARSGGVQDNQAVERRSDLLLFTSAPLEEPIEVIGEVIAELSATRDNPNADVFVRLCDVDPRGRSRNVCDGIVRLTRSDPLATTVRVSLVGTAHRFDRGHRLRLQVAGGAHPRFARNPGTGAVDAAAEEFVGVEYRVDVGASPGSVVLLPVVIGEGHDPR